LGLLALASAILVPRSFSGEEETQMAVRAVSYAAYLVFCVWSGLISWNAHPEDRWAKLVSFLLVLEMFVAISAASFILVPI
jgi:hypothetical protein